MTLDLSLANTDLWNGLAIETLAGRLTLTTPPAEAIPVLAANLANMAIDPEEVVLTGSMVIWSYLVVFHGLPGGRSAFSTATAAGRRCWWRRTAERTYNRRTFLLLG